MSATDSRGYYVEARALERIVAERDKAIAERDAARDRIERALAALRDPNTHRAWKARDAALDILTEGQEA